MPTNYTLEGYDSGFTYTSPVSSYPPNGFGLFDMLGNVWEVCADGFSENYEVKQDITQDPYRKP
jgi:formylglycine-generating enzyme required for sulfatase activity